MHNSRQVVVLLVLYANTNTFSSNEIVIQLWAITLWQCVDKLEYNECVFQVEKFRSDQASNNLINHLNPIFNIKLWPENPSTFFLLYYVESLGARLLAIRFFQVRSTMIFPFWSSVKQKTQFLFQAWTHLLIVSYIYIFWICKFEVVLNWKLTKVYC